MILIDFAIIYFTERYYDGILLRSSRYCGVFVMDWKEGMQEVGLLLLKLPDLRFLAIWLLILIMVVGLIAIVGLIQAPRIMRLWIKIIRKDAVKGVR